MFSMDVSFGGALPGDCRNIDGYEGWISAYEFLADANPAAVAGHVDVIVAPANMARGAERR
jgi:hypothetical protein